MLLGFSLCVSVTPLAPAANTGNCGVDRWEVKTLSDIGARKVSSKVEDTTVKWLTSQKNPISSKGTPPKNRLAPFEYRTFRVRAQVIGYKLETDGDFHIVIADPGNPQQTMVVEIPDPQCNGANKSGYAEKYQSARAEIIHLVGPPQRSLVRPGNAVTVLITGVGFFDIFRKQTGAALNGVELHPVIAIQP